MKYHQDTYLYKGTKVTNTWIKTDNLENYSPITQVYGIVFNDKNEVIICRESNSGSWIIPGGHPEEGESIEQTLKRELQEEVDVEIEDIKPLGVQKVTFPDDVNSDKAIYQVRCIAKLKKLNSQTPDPANGNTWERKFIPASEITNYVKWGKTGEVMFKDAVEVYSSGLKPMI